MRKAVAPPTPTKRCTHCGETKSIDSFSKRSAAPDGRSYRCFACRREYAERQSTYVPNV